MEALIASTIIIFSIVKHVWDVLHLAYANKSQTRVFSLCDQLSRCIYDTQFIVNYLSRSNFLIDETVTSCSQVSYK